MEKHVSTCQKTFQGCTNNQKEWNRGLPKYLWVIHKLNSPALDRVFWDNFAKHMISFFERHLVRGYRTTLPLRSHMILSPCLSYFWFCSLTCISLTCISASMSSKFLLAICDLSFCWLDFWQRTRSCFSWCGCSLHLQIDNTCGVVFISYIYHIIVSCSSSLSVILFYSVKKYDPSLR